MEDIIEEDEAVDEATPTILNEFAAEKDPNSQTSSRTPFRTFEDASEKVLENGRLRDAVILMVIFRSIDLLFLLNTVVLWVKYDADRKRSYYLLTFLLYAVPGLILPLISVGRTVSFLLRSRNGTSGSSAGPPFLIELALYVLFGPHIGAFTKWVHISKLRSRSLKEQQRLLIIRMADEVTVYYVITNFLQSTTQFVLQLYLFSHKEGENYTNAQQIGRLQVCQLVWSALCLTCAMTAWEESLIRINWPVMVITFFWKLFTLSSRLVSLSLCLIVSFPSFVGICVAHWFVFTLLVTFKVRGVRPKNIFLGPALALVYVVNDSNLSYPESFPHRLLFYSLSFAEGVFMMTMWILLSEHSVWHYYWVSVLVYLFFFVGVFFFRFKHECDYSKVRPKHRRTHERLKFYVFNSCLRYPEYDKAGFVEMENDQK